MINDTIEIDAWTPGVIRKRWREYTARSNDLSDETVAALIVFFELEDEDREAFLRAVPAFVCNECGRPSCLHGYSDE